MGFPLFLQPPCSRHEESDFPSAELQAFCHQAKTSEVTVYDAESLGTWTVFFLLINVLARASSTRHSTWLGASFQ